MKKIYTVTLDDDVPLSRTIGSDIREIAFWVYSELGKFNRQILCIDDDEKTNSEGLIKNDLFDIPCNKDYIYKFTSDFKNIDKRMFEPFVLNDISFGFTVYDESISDSEVAIILEGILKLLKFNYKFNIDSIQYDDTNIKNRFAAINKVMNKEEKVNSNVKKRVKLMLNPIVSILGL